MRIKDLLWLLKNDFDVLSFDSKAVAEMLQNFSRVYPNLHLVDNPKGLTTKWISNDLKRLYSMSFLGRTKEKRPVLELAGDFNRGYRYRYHISDRGFKYVKRMQESGFQLGSRWQYLEEIDIFRQTEKPLLSDTKKAARRYLLRVSKGIVPPLNPAVYKLHAVDHELFLAQCDRDYRKAVGFNRRYT